MKSLQVAQEGPGAEEHRAPHAHIRQQRRGDTGQAEAAEEIQGGAAHPEKDEPAGPTVRRDGRVREADRAGAKRR